MSRPLDAIRKLHWCVPSVLVASWFVGLGLVIAHHLYYYTLDGRFVTSESQQTWSTRIGTGLALVIETLFGTAITTACTQILWQRLRDRPVSLATLDSLFGVTTSPIEIANFRTWVAAPVVVALASLAWLLPFVTVVTPATLTVFLSSIPKNSTRLIPQPVVNYENTDVFMQWGQIINTDFRPPPPRIQRLVAAVASQGRILALPAPELNSSYTSTFFGLSLQCDDTDQGVYGQALEAMKARGGSSIITYAAFAPTGPANTLDYPTDGIMEGLNATIKVPFGDPNVLTREPSILDTIATDASRLIVMVQSLEREAKLFECKAYNSSYTVDFNFESGVQNITTRSIDKLNSISMKSVFAELGFRPRYDFSEIPNIDQHPCFSMCGQCSYPGLSYLSLLKEFGSLLQGMIYRGGGSEWAIVDTAVASTALNQAVEMPEVDERVTCDPSLGDQKIYSMKEALEGLMQNITISLFSVSDFLKPEDHTNQIELQIRSPANVYKYNSVHLLLAYGAAFIVTTTAVALSAYTMVTVGGSQDTSFTTFMRTTRSIELSDLVEPKDTRGFTPLPDSLEKSMVSFRRCKGEGDDSELYSFVPVRKDTEHEGGEMSEIVRTSEEPARPLIEENGVERRSESPSSLDMR